MNRRSSVLISCTLPALLAGCATAPVQPADSSPAPQIEASRSSDTIEQWSFKSRAPRADLDELFTESDVVVRGTVTRLEYKTVESLPKTVFSVRVDKSWTRTVKRGDTLVVIRDGGVWSEADAMRSAGRPLDSEPTKEQEARMVSVLIDGQPLPKVGEESIYFLTRDTGDWASRSGLTGAVYLCSPDEGVFRLSRGKAKRVKGRDFKADGLDEMPAAALEQKLDDLTR